MATETRTFTSDIRRVTAPLDTISLEPDSSIVVKVKDNITNTFVGTKKIPISDITDVFDNFEIEASNTDNPFSIEFQRTPDLNISPQSVVYKIYQNVQLQDGQNERTLVAQFTIFSELQGNEFRYYFEIQEVDTARIDLSFGGRIEGTRYTVNDELSLFVTSKIYNSSLSRVIGISYVDNVSGKLFDKNAVRNSIKNSVDDNLAISGSTVEGSISIINERITESQRFLKYGVITDDGNNLVVTNWVDGGVLNQVDTEIEPLGSLVLELYNNASPLSIKDKVIFTELYANDIELEVDLSEEDEEAGLRRLTPNFQKEVEENTISTFNEYQSFDDLTLSGSSVQERIIDFFLQRKKEAVGLNTDFTNFNNFVKFSSAEERLVNFHYKVTQLEDLTDESASLATASVSSSTFKENRIEEIRDEIRTIKNGFDEYEQFLFNDSGSIYENKPFVSASAGIFASWPKNTPTEEITNGDFSSTGSWSVSGSNTRISGSHARIYRGGEISQSLALTPDTGYVLTFDTLQNGLPISFEYNGKSIVNETIVPSGSAEFKFTTRNLENSEDVIKIIGASFGDDNRYTAIDNLSVKETPTLLDSTSTEVKNWFDSFTNVAFDYDGRNKDSLVNNTPEYIRSDSQNSDYILFLSMIGQMFDEIWLYGKELGNLYDWDNSIENGLSEDLSIVLLEAYGNNLDIGFSEKDVWEYILGVDRNEDEIGRQIEFSFERRQKETIRRLLVNLPYFLKHKGTARSVKGLVLSYGIPLSTMFIREYGTFQAAEGLETIFTREKETKKLDMEGSSKSISSFDSSLSPSNAIEFNFQLKSDASGDISLVSGSNSVGGGFEISISASNGSGSIELSIVSGSDTFTLATPAGPLYNGDFWNVIVQKTASGSYEVRSYQFNRDDGVFDYTLSNTGSTASSGTLDLAFQNGTDITFTNFNGYLDEFRVWNTVVSEANFREHAKFPTSIKLDDPLKIPQSLLMRVDIETDTSKYIAEGENRLPNLVFNPQYPTQVTASGFVVSDFETFTRTDYINSTNVGNEKLGNNKVRYQITQSLAGNVLTPNSDFEAIDQSNENITDVEDSYKLTIGFSPTDITNEIILQHFGGNDLLDEFGDPLNTYEDTYPELQKTVEDFFENISVNRKTRFFIEYIRNFDKTLFENIRKFVPERADLITSIFIEPHFLDRSKAKRLGQSETEDLFNDGEAIDTPYTVSSAAGSDGTDSQIIVSEEEIWVGEALSISDTQEATTVISESEVLDYLNQTTEVIILQSGFESRVLQNNIWEEDSSIQVTNRFGETFRFKVYKFDYEQELADLEAEIGNYLSTSDLDYTSDDGTKQFESDKTYSDLTRLWQRYYELHDTLFLLDFNAPVPDNAVLVTYEDLPTWLKEDLILSTSTTSTNKTVTKAGITYEVSDDTIDGGSVVETTTVQDTKTIVSDPDADIKLTVE